MIHEQVADIPTPKDISAKDALGQLKMLMEYGAITEEDSIERRLMVLASLFDCCDQPTADALRKQLTVVNKFYAQPP